MTKNKKVASFFSVTPPVAAPGDTRPSDATAFFNFRLQPNSRTSQKALKVLTDFMTEVGLVQICYI